MVHEFFVVTINFRHGSSVYHASDKDKDGGPSVTKVALKGGSKWAVGRRFGGGMIAICKTGLVSYVPERSSHDFPAHPGHERRIEHVHHEHRTGNTSDVVALFKTEEEARHCLRHHDLQPCDKRWFEKTKEVLREIGVNHPVFYIADELRRTFVPRHREW